MIKLMARRKRMGSWAIRGYPFGNSFHFPLYNRDSGKSLESKIEE
jgi:hypothetical protein